MTALRERRPIVQPRWQRELGTWAGTVQQHAVAVRRWGERRNGRTRAVTVVVELCLIALVFSVPLWQTGGFEIDRFAVSLIYIAGALGLNLLFGYAGEFSFAPGLVMGIAAYTTGILSVHVGLPLVPSMIVATLGGIVASLLLHLSGLRVRGWYFALTSFFALLVFPKVVDLLPQLTGGDEGLTGVPTLRPFGTSGSDAVSYEIIAVLVVATIVLFRIALRRSSRLRLIFLTLHHSPRACQAVGISTVRVKLFAYMLAGVPLGIAGVLLAHLQGSVSYGSFGLAFAIALFAGVILGRPGNFWGPLVGVACVYAISLWIGPFSSYNALVLAGAILVVALVFPHGRRALRHPGARDAAPGEGLEATEALEAGLSMAGPGSVPVQAPANGPGHGPTVEQGRPTPGAGAAVPVGAPHDDPVSAGDVEVSDPGRECLVVDGVEKAFGGHVVLRSVDLSIAEGEIVGLLGPNGSGKTTLLNVLSGLVRPDGGEVRLFGRSLLGLPPAVISKAGLARTFQVPEVVQMLSVRENIEIATFGGSIFGRCVIDERLVQLLGMDQAARSPRDVAANVCAWLGLDDTIVDRTCGELSLGLRRIVEIGRAVAFGATLMCLDEPAAGLNANDSQLVAAALRQFCSQSRCAMLVVEHNPSFILGLSDRVVLLEEGVVVDEYRAGGGAMPLKLQSFLALEDLSISSQ